MSLMDNQRNTTAPASGASERPRERRRPAPPSPARPRRGARASASGPDATRSVRPRSHPLFSLTSEPHEGGKKGVFSRFCARRAELGAGSAFADTQGAKTKRTCRRTTQSRSVRIGTRAANALGSPRPGDGEALPARLPFGDGERHRLYCTDECAETRNRPLPSLGPSSARRAAWLQGPGSPTSPGSRGPRHVSPRGPSRGRDEPEPAPADESTRGLDNKQLCSWNWPEAGSGQDGLR